MYAWIKTFKEYGKKKKKKKSISYYDVIKDSLMCVEDQTLTWKLSNKIFSL